MNQIIKLQGAKGLYLAPQQHDAQTFIKVFTNQAKQQKNKAKNKKIRLNYDDRTDKKA